MKSNGFTLIELLIVIVIIALLASLLIPAIVAAIDAARETRTSVWIKQFGDASVLYARDHNVHPPTGPSFETGPAIFVLSQPAAQRGPYLKLMPDDVMAWPPSPASHLRNPVDDSLMIRYRDNTLNPPIGGGPPVHNRFGVDIWAENARGNPTGLNNWGGSN